MLVGAIKGERVLLFSEPAWLYLQHSLVITKIYQLLQYKQSKSFQSFGESLSAIRRRRCQPNQGRYCGHCKACWHFLYWQDHCWQGQAQESFARWWTRSSRQACVQFQLWVLAGAWQWRALQDLHAQRKGRLVFQLLLAGGGLFFVVFLFFFACFYVRVCACVCARVLCWWLFFYWLCL